jgi:hypothetical protein
MKKMHYLTFEKVWRVFKNPENILRSDHRQNDGWMDGWSFTAL